MKVITKIKNYFDREEVKLPQRSLDDLKQISRILFIDDQSFKVVTILRNAGWVNTTWIRDVDSLDSSNIMDAHIVFVDINGVGRKLKFKDEGLGLVTALRHKYPFKKLILYSAERSGDRFHPAFSDADARLAKNADPFEFQTLVEQFSMDAFSLAECVERLRMILRKDFGITMTDSDVRDKLTTLMKKKDTSLNAVNSIFNIHNAISIAHIVHLFFMGK